MRPRRVLETALYASDLEAAERFYGGTLNLEVIGRVAGRHVFFRCGDGVLLVFDPTATAATEGQVPPHGASGPGHVAFAATREELDLWRSRFERDGVAIEAGVTWPRGGHSIYVRDPAGNSVELAEPALWGIEEP